MFGVILYSAYYLRVFGPFVLTEYLKTGKRNKKKHHSTSYHFYQCGTHTVILRKSTIAYLSKPSKEMLNKKILNQMKTVPLLSLVLNNPYFSHD